MFSFSRCLSDFKIVTVAAVDSITTPNLLMVQPCTYVHSLYVTVVVRKDALAGSPMTRWFDRERDNACDFETTSVEETSVISGAIGVPLSVV